MKIVYLRILVISLTLSSLSCTSVKSEPSKLPSQNKRALQAQLSELKDTISQKHFDPNYKPFFKGLTMKMIFEVLNNDSHVQSTASGPGNPLKIDCYPNYSDDGTGTYYYHLFDSENSRYGTFQINVSIWGKGFWMGDTTQRINSILIIGEHAIFDQILPFKRDLSVSQLDSLMEKVETGVYTFKQNDYQFWYTTENSNIHAILIKRSYCPQTTLQPTELWNNVKIKQ